MSFDDDLSWAELLRDDGIRTFSVRRCPAGRIRRTSLAILGGPRLLASLDRPCWSRERRRIVDRGERGGRRTW